MIRRLFYMALGAFGAVWVMRKLQTLHPNHLARRAVRNATGILEQARDFAGDALDGAAERETVLRSRFGLDTVENPYNYDVKDGR
ncbi:hypothetical protein FHS43_006297 [Streptosporangium becharense]|uniref:Uncharacterized protein n=1 Tax=Streptosporangium becharense TaxID=1816182 RepID=A0A7W9ID27_9ACTN|nr:hypothetical protein [Streptosporangium becharense]MBB2914982.1 hypothetical protein [Streptosporangium becharense]MBB5818031.1 hypothetical protein [Streptosporangium becharense]